MHIFAVMLGTVPLVQPLNFAAFIIMPPPKPVLYTTSRIAAIAQAGSDPTGLLTVRLTTTPPAAQSELPDKALAALIASDLALPIASVVVSRDHDGPPTIADVFRPPTPRSAGAGRPSARPIDDALFGDFAVTIRQPDGIWCVVQPTERRFSSWRRASFCGS